MLPKGLQTLTFETWGPSTVTGSPPTLAAFTRPDDPSYGVLHDIMVKLADDIRNVRIVEVNCAAEPTLCKNFQVKRFPYLAYFTEDTTTSGVESARPYLGKRNAEGLRQFIKKITTPAINEIESAPSVDVMIDEITAGGERSVFMMVQPALPPIKANTTRIEGPKDPLVEAFRLVTFRMRDRYGFANIRANALKDVGGLQDCLPSLPEGVVNATFVVRLGLADCSATRKVPMLLGFQGAKAVPYAYRAMAGLAKERRHWGGGGGGGGALPDPSKDPVQAGLLAWAQRWRHPLVTLLPRNLTDLAANVEGRFVAVAVLAGQESAEAALNRPFLELVERLADPHETPLEGTLYDRALFAKIKNGAAQGTFYAQYALGDAPLPTALPTLLAIDASDPSKQRRVQWANGNEVRDEDGIVEW
jgi:hypothetical protein